TATGGAPGSWGLREAKCAARAAAAASRRSLCGWQVRLANRHPVGAGAVPLVDVEAVGFEERADPGPAPAGDVLQHGHEDAERVVAEHRAAGDLRDGRSLGDRDPVALAPVDVAHHG